MESVTSLVTTLENFGKELCNMKKVIHDMEVEIKNCVVSIKEEAEAAEDNLQRIRMGIKRLQHQKIVEEREQHDRQNSLNSPPVTIKNNWWKERSEIDDGSPIDWDKEHQEREDLKCCLMVKEGWRTVNASHEELQSKFRQWTGKAMQWTPIKRGKATNTGKTMMNVKFENKQDYAKVYEMRKAIAEEGHLFIGEALSHVEKKERWTMLMMSERLKSEGREVEFDNRKICVDGEWWKYCWTNGWRRI